MEVYFKDLISNESMLDKIVDDLSLVVDGADHFAKAVGANLPEGAREELASRVIRMRRHHHRFMRNARIRARATDRLVRRNPYWFVGVALAVGLLAGTIVVGRQAEPCESES